MAGGRRAPEGLSGMHVLFTEHGDLLFVLNYRSWPNSWRALEFHWKGGTSAILALVGADHAAAAGVRGIDSGTRAGELTSGVFLLR